MDLLQRAGKHLNFPESFGGTGDDGQSEPQLAEPHLELHVFVTLKLGGRKRGRKKVVDLTSNAVQRKLDYTAWSAEVSPRQGNQCDRGENRNRTHQPMDKSAPAIAKKLWCSVWHSTFRLLFFLIILIRKKNIASFGFHIFTLTQNFQ